MIHSLLYERPTVSRSDGQIEYRYAGGWLKCFGFIAFLGSLAAFYHGALMTLESRYLNGLFEFAIIGPLCVIVGLVLYFLDRGVLLDKERRTVMSWLNLFFPWGASR